MLACCSYASRIAMGFRSDVWTRSATHGARGFLARRHQADTAMAGHGALVFALRRSEDDGRGEKCDHNHASENFEGARDGDGDMHEQHRFAWF